MSIGNMQLQDYLEGRLSDREALKVQLYLADHGDDPSLLSQLDAHFDDCRVEATSHDRDMLSELHRRIAAGRVRTGFRFAAVAALLMLMMLPAAWFLGRRSRPVEAPVVWQEMTVPAAETRTLDLSDGTRLVLNAGSRITWPDRFTSAEREVFLEGEVLAMVSKDEAHPFVIHSGDVNVCVHGTTFAFKSFRDEAQAQLLLFDGSVSLDVPSPEGKRAISMAPGDMALFDREAGEVSLSKISTDNFRPFTEGRSFSFFNAPLRDIAASLQRGFGRRIVIGDAGIQDTRYLAFFTNGESLDDILKLLCKNGNLRVVHSDNTIYLYGKKH